MGSTGKYVAIASLYNWEAGGYYTNEWFLGTIDDSKTFKLEDRGLLDYGQYYAARTGSEDQSPTGRRVLFSATGWHNPPGMASCHTQVHLIPRDMVLDAKDRVTFSPIPEIASTLRKNRTMAEPLVRFVPNSNLLLLDCRRPRLAYRDQCRRFHPAWAN